MRFLSLTLILATCAYVAPTPLHAAVTDEHETMVSIDTIPGPARDAILAKMAGFTVTEVEVETENGVVTYEGSAISSGHEYEVKVDATGTEIADGEHHDDDGDEDENDEEDGEHDDGDDGDDQENEDGDGDHDEADISEHENEGEEHGEH